MFVFLPPQSCAFVPGRRCVGAARSGGGVFPGFGQLLDALAGSRCGRALRGSEATHRRGGERFGKNIQTLERPPHGFTSWTHRYER